jgi:endonuclease YncB( thermonuclease family)
MTERVYGPYPATVVRVIDGDTIVLNLDLGFNLTLEMNCRVFGINAPELRTDAGKLARDYASSLLPVGDKVLVWSHGWDKYGGRFDGDVTAGDGAWSFAGAMLNAGYAVPFHV